MTADPTGPLVVLANVGDLMAELRTTLAAHRGITVTELDAQTDRRLARREAQENVLRFARTRRVSTPVPHDCPYASAGTCPTCETAGERRRERD